MFALGALSGERSDRPCLYAVLRAELGSHIRMESVLYVNRWRYANVPLDSCWYEDAMSSSMMVVCSDHVCERWCRSKMFWLLVGRLGGGVCDGRIVLVA